MYQHVEKAKVVFCGAGIKSVSLLEMIEEMNSLNCFSWEILGFLDDGAYAPDAMVNGYPVIGKLTSASRLPNDVSFINGIYNYSTCRRLTEILSKTEIGYDRWLNLIHPSTWISPSATLENGVIAYPFTVVHHHAKVGHRSLLMPRSTVGIHNTVGQDTIVGTNCILAGYANVESNVYLGQGSCVKERVTVGRGAIVGMGAVVTKDVDENAVVVGNPAKKLERAEK